MASRILSLATAQPKHTITTELWRTSETTYAFETVTDEDTFVIRDGLAEVAPATSNGSEA